jgi:Flp pilus assembly protein TadD
MMSPLKMASLVMALLLVSPAFDANGQTESADVAEQVRRLKQADAALKGARYTQAENLLTWLEQNAGPEIREDAALLKAEYWLVQGRVDLATEATKAIYDRSRNRCRQDNIFGWIAYSKQELNEAVLNLASATARCPANIGSWNLLGLSLLDKHEYAASRSAFEHALQSEPQNAGLLNNIALTWLVAGDAGAARVILNKAQLLASDNPAIRANYDFALAMLGEAPQRGRFESDQQWARRLLNAGEGAKKSGNDELATSMFSRAVMLLDHFDSRAWQVAGRSERKISQ